MKITYIHHSAFLAELCGAALLFDYTEGPIPEIRKEKPLFVFASHRHGDHFSQSIFGLRKSHENIRYILSDDIWRKRLPKEELDFVDSMKHGQRNYYDFKDGRILSAEDKERSSLEVFTLRSTDEGVAFLIKTEGKVIYHAGDLNNWRWEGEPDNWNESMAKKYTEQVDRLSGTHVDLAFLPLDPRQEKDFYLGFDEFMKKVDVKAAFPMHCWGDFSVIRRLKEMEISAPYRARVITIHRDGEYFPIDKEE